MKGCKSWKAKQIADSVFELLNEILTKLHEKKVADSLDSDNGGGGNN